MCGKEEKKNSVKEWEREREGIRKRWRKCERKERYRNKRKTWSKEKN